MAFHIRIPTEDEFDYPPHIAIGSPTEMSCEWEEVAYELWSSRKVFKFIIAQAEQIRAELRHCIATKQKTDEKEFKEKRDMVCRAIRHLKPYLKENAMYRCRILESIDAIQSESVKYKKLFSK
jgi:hypothetical protein